MKKKLKKNWLGRLKNKEEIHQDSKEWISEIEFIQDEIRLLDRLLGSNYIECVELGYCEKVKELKLVIIQESSNGQTLFRIIIDHEKVLSELIENESIDSNVHYFEIHERIEREMFSFITTYKNLKKDIYDLIDEIMEKKKLKKLS